MIAHTQLRKEETKRIDGEKPRGGAVCYAFIHLFIHVFIPNAMVKMPPSRLMLKKNAEIGRVDFLKD